MDNNVHTGTVHVPFRYVRITNNKIEQTLKQQHKFSKRFETKKKTNNMYVGFKFKATREIVSVGLHYLSNCLQQGSNTIHTVIRIKHFYN